MIPMTHLRPLGFLSHPSAHEISTATKKTFGPIAAFTGKLNRFDLPSKR